MVLEQPSTNAPIAVLTRLFRGARELEHREVTKLIYNYIVNSRKRAIARGWACTISFIRECRLRLTPVNKQLAGYNGYALI